MNYKVLKSFGGIVSGTKGNIIKITDKKIAEDLIRAEYIEEYTGLSKEDTETTKKLQKKIEDLEKEKKELIDENKKLKEINKIK